jgi:hypothetical protein
MAKISVTYRAPKGDEKVVEMGGHTFFDGKVEKVDSEIDTGLLAKLRTNQHFDVSDKEQAKAAAKSAETVLMAVEQGDEFVVKNGDEVIKKGLTKEDAEVFNALSDEDKAEYVKA